MVKISSLRIMHDITQYYIYTVKCGSYVYFFKEVEDLLPVVIIIIS